MFSNPEKNTEQFGLTPGMVVADFGSGSGFYAFAAAKAVQSSGKVYALDLQKDLLSKLKKEAERRGLYNIEAIWGDIERKGGSRLASKIVQAAIVSNILFQISDKDGFVEEVARVLRPGGKAFVIDWTDSFGGLGPHRDAVFGREKAVELFLRHGFREEKNISAGAHHYGVVFVKDK